MKTLRFISTFAMLALATVVTAGSMYVTAFAAAQQESTDEFNVAPPTLAAVQDAEGEVVPGLEAAIAGVDAPLDKTQILRDRQSHVVLDEMGGFNGRVSSLRNADGELVAAANLKVRLAHHGAIIGSTTTDANGRFSFTGLPEGVVAIWAEGEDSLMLFSVVLFGQNTDIPENAGLVASHLELDTDSAVSFGADVTTVKELMSSYVNIEDKRFATEVTEADQEFSVGSGEVSATVLNHRVRLQNDGSLKGQVGILDERTGRLREVLDMTVHFVRNGVQVASSEVSNDGSFTANRLSPGVHSVVVVGQDGILVCAVDVVGMNYEENRVQDAGLGEFIPAHGVAASLNFSGSPVGAKNLHAFTASGGSGGGFGQTAMIDSLAPLGNACYGGGGGTSGGGGGGGVGGGGGFGALWGLAALGLGAYAISKSNDDDACCSPGI